MAFNIMNVSSIEVQSVSGFVSTTTFTALVTAPANGICKIKNAKFLTSSTNVGSFRIQLTGDTGTLYPSNFVLGQGVIPPVNWLEDVYLKEGTSLLVKVDSQNYPVRYIISYEIWT